MINIFRKYQQGLMIGITILVIISFVWFYNRTSMDKLANSQDTIAKIYGRGVSEVEVQRYARKLQLSADLGLFDLLQHLAGSTRERMYEDFVWNMMVLEHEADANQILPTDEAVAAEIKTLAPFQTQGQFDPEKYANFIQDKLSPKGFTEQQLEDVVRDELKLRKFKEIIGSTVAAAPSEVRVAFDTQYQTNELSLIRLDQASIAAGIQVSDEDVRKAYDQRKDSLKSEETRKVKFVTFALPSSDKSLTGKERTEALQKLANRATEFTQAMLAKDANFDAVAAQFNLTVDQTGEFSQAKPDAKLSGNPTVVAEAFRLTPNDPNSDAVQTQSGFYVLHLENVNPARLLTFEEVSATLKEALKNERAREALALKGNDIHNKIEAAMKAGKSFADAAKDAGVKVENFPTFSLADLSEKLSDLLKKAESTPIIQKSMELSVGQLSELVPVQDGGVLVYVDKRTPVSDDKFEKEKDSLTQNFTRSKQTLAFREWLRMRRDAAKIEAVRS